MKKLIVFLLIATMLFAGCIKNPEKGTTIFFNSSNQTTKENFLFMLQDNRFVKFNTTEYEIIHECIELCNKKLENKEDLSKGPCLSDSSKDWPINKYVCDVVHFPRDITIDNKKENQCKDFIELKANHFIEVSTNCSLVRVV